MRNLRAIVYEHTSRNTNILNISQMVQRIINSSRVGSLISAITFRQRITLGPWHFLNRSVIRAEAPRKKFTFRLVFEALRPNTRKEIQENIARLHVFLHDAQYDDPVDIARRDVLSNFLYCHCSASTQR